MEVPRADYPRPEANFFRDSSPLNKVEESHDLTRKRSSFSNRLGQTNNDDYPMIKQDFNTHWIVTAFRAKWRRWRGACYCTDEQESLQITHLPTRRFKEMLETLIRCTFEPSFLLISSLVLQELKSVNSGSSLIKRYGMSFRHEEHVKLEMR